MTGPSPTATSLRDHMCGDLRAEHVGQQVSLCGWVARRREHGEHLAFIDIMSPVTMRNLRSNPYIEVNMVDPFLRRGYRFKGKCEIVTEGPVFDEVAGELWTREGRQYPANAVVRIKVETALSVKSPAYVFNKGVKEEDVRRIWLDRYGVKPKD